MRSHTRTHTHAHTHTHTHTHTYSLSLSLSLSLPPSLTHAHTQTHKHNHIYSNIHPHKQVPMYIHMYTHIYVYIYIYIRTHTCVCVFVYVYVCLSLGVTWIVYIKFDSDIGSGWRASVTSLIHTWHGSSWVICMWNQPTEWVKGRVPASPPKFCWLFLTLVSRLLQHTLLIELIGPWEDVIPKIGSSEFSVTFYTIPFYPWKRP